MNCVCLFYRFLGHGGSYRTLAFSYRIGESIVRAIVYSTCEAIWKRLRPIVMAPPNVSKWEQVAEGFSAVS